MADSKEDALVAKTLAGGDEKPAKKGGLLPTIASVAVLTIVALGGGAGVGWLVGGQSMERAEAALKPEKAANDAAPAREPAESPNLVIKLEPMITNIATPAKIVVRVQGSIVVRKEEVGDPAVLAGLVQGDTLAFLRTIDLAQIEGARGLLHLKEDLTERAKLRSPAISDYLIESLVAQ